MFNELVKNKLIVCVIIAFAVIAVMWIFMPGRGGQDTGVNQQTQVSEQSEQESVSDTADSGEPGYYFVKVTDGAVNVYWYENGEKELYRETSIEYSLLSSEDQLLLETGIKLENDQELAGFLENFDS